MYEYDPKEPDYVWRYEARCSDPNNYPPNEKGERVIDTNLFYPPRNKVLYKISADKAKAICWGTAETPPCPVRKECLLYAVKMEDTHGIYGGMSHRERAHLERKHKKEVAQGKTTKSFRKWVLDGDDGTEDKARQFLKAVPRHEENPNETPGQYRTVYLGPAKTTP
jgi:Transcription factor WhiB